jgi:hypothetical protein
MSLLLGRWLLSVLLLAKPPRAVITQGGTPSHEATRANPVSYPTSLHNDAMNSELEDCNVSRISKEPSHALRAARNLVQFSPEETDYLWHVAS